MAAYRTFAIDGGFFDAGSYAGGVLLWPGSYFGKEYTPRRIRSSSPFSTNSRM